MGKIRWRGWNPPSFGAPLYGCGVGLPALVEFADVQEPRRAFFRRSAHFDNSRTVGGAGISARHRQVAPWISGEGMAEGLVAASNSRPCVGKHRVAAARISKFGPSILWVGPCIFDMGTGSGTAHTREFLASRPTSGPRVGAFPTGLGLAATIELQLALRSS